MKHTKYLVITKSEFDSGEIGCISCTLWNTKSEALHFKKEVNFLTKKQIKELASLDVDIEDEIHHVYKIEKVD